MPAPATLEPKLGPIDAAAIVVSNVIGGGIFFVPQMARNGPFLRPAARVHPRYHTPAPAIVGRRFGAGS